MQLQNLINKSGIAVILPILQKMLVWIGLCELSKVIYPFFPHSLRLNIKKKNKGVITTKDYHNH